MYANKCSISKNIHSNDGRAIVTDIAEAFAFDDEPTSSFTTPSLRFEMMLVVAHFCPNESQHALRSRGNGVPCHL